MAKAAKITIVEAEEIVPPGAMGPSEIHLPGVYVNHVVKGSKYEKRIERLTLLDPASGKLRVISYAQQRAGVTMDSTSNQPTKDEDPKRIGIVKRAAQEFRVSKNVFILLSVWQNSWIR
jgi:hypothetical protein